ncbi:hypothetical protein D3C87_832860 [compost metagenome]
MAFLQVSVILTLFRNKVHLRICILRIFLFAKNEIMSKNLLFKKKSLHLLLKRQKDFCVIEKNQSDSLDLI